MMLVDGFCGRAKLVHESAKREHECIREKRKRLSTTIKMDGYVHSKTYVYIPPTYLLCSLHEKCERDTS